MISGREKIFIITKNLYVEYIFLNSQYLYVSMYTEYIMNSYSSIKTQVAQIKKKNKNTKLYK